MLPLLAPLLGSLLGPSLFSSMGLTLSPLLAQGLGSGLASLAAGRDPKEALLSGIMTGGLGALMGGLGGGAEAAAGVADVAGKTAGLPMTDAGTAAALAGAKGALPASGLGGIQLPSPTDFVDDKLIIDGNLARQGSGGLGGLMNWAREHPMMTAGALALPSLLENPAEYEPEESEDIPENFPTGPGPRSGYDRTTPVMGQSISPEYWTRYGRASSEKLPGGYSGEWQFFPDNELRAPAADPTGPGSGNGGRGGRGGRGGSFGGSFDTSTLPGGDDFWERIKSRFMGQGYAQGGLVVGPGDGSGVDDMVQAVGPGNEPIRLSSGEYVMPARAVDNAGGPDAMDRLRARLLRASN